jgi:hypothetical protein
MAREGRNSSACKRLPGSTIESARSPLFPDVILDRRVTALKLVLVAQPFKNALGGVALFTGTLQIVLHPLIDEDGEPIQLGPLDLRRALIARRHREHHHLLHARTRNPEMASSLPFAHTATTREADLPVKFHAENTPALPANRKRQSGKVLFCPQQDYPATSVAHFCIAVSRTGRPPKRIREDHFGFLIRILEALPSHIDRSSARGASSLGGVGMEEFDYLKRVVLADQRFPFLGFS